MQATRISRNGEVIEIPPLTAVIEPEGRWFVSRCPELDVASQGRSRKEAHAMLAEAVALWLECASANEIRRRLKIGARVQPLDLVLA
ncbi:MAG: type II toxin-antitoxin system HicB family antitoxin [Limisphaerales bacterium]